MATVHFYEKPGCANNTRQKSLLIKAGHTLVAHDLLGLPWANQLERLRSFFGVMPVSDWFNPAAPAIKNGRVQPEVLSDQQALALMANDPLLIRRPLLESEGMRCAGFDSELVNRLLTGLKAPDGIEQCPKNQHEGDCQP